MFLYSSSSVTKLNKIFLVLAKVWMSVKLREQIKTRPHCTTIQSYMLPSNMNLRIGKVRNYNNKILISSPSFKIGTNVKINLDVKSKEVEMVKTEPDVKQKKNLMSSPI